MRALCFSVASLGFAALALACGSSPKPAPQAAPLMPVYAPVVASAPPAPLPKADNGTSGMVNISEDIRKACGITDGEAYFAFDSAAIRPEDRRIIDKLSTCFTTAALRGQTMKLVGHADPRGDDAYNMALGGRRADSVKAVLVQEGMPTARVVTTSRGKMDATGTDESSWAWDRRVDILVGA